MTKSRSTNRRQFLRGAGGFTLALPFLPSLLDPRRVAAATAAPTKRFVQICTQHGGVWGTNMYPGDATLTDKTTYAGYSVKRGKLAPQTSGTTAKLSSVLSGPSSLLTPALAGKMNVLRGLDVPWYIGHHTGGHLGNFARNDGNGTDGQQMQAYPTPTIDQVMAWSSKFYGSLDSIQKRSLVIGSRISYNWSNPSSTTDRGPVQEVAGSRDALALFKQIFINTGGTTTMADPNAALKPLADRVLADYQRLRTSNTRLSSDDRRRLDDHMQRISELQRKLTVHAANNSCPSVTHVTTNTSSLVNMSSYAVDTAMQTQVYQAMNEVVAAAFICDTSRIAVMNIGEDFSSYVGDWHQDVAHHSADLDGAKQGVLAAAHQLTFANVFLDLCSRLDVDDGTGKTYLDNSLVVWTQESGEYTHAGQGMPIVTAGSAGGFLTTGNYCDYRNPAFVTDKGEQGNSIKIYGGLLWQQWLGTALQAMGLDRKDFETNGLGGYPTPVKFVSKDFPYPDAVWKTAGEVLPYLKA